MRFPLEVTTIILNFTDGIDDLLNLRLSCTAFRRIVTPKAFSTVTVTSLAGSAEKCRNIQGSAQIARYVQKLVFNEEGGDEPLGTFVLYHGQQGHDDMDDTIQCFTRLDAFPALTTLALYFYGPYEDGCPYEIPNERHPKTALQLALLEKLFMKSIRPPSLNTFILHNIIPSPVPTHWRSSNFREFMRPINRFSISGLSCGDHSAHYSCAPFVSFWTETLYAILEPATSLISLSIRSYSAPICGLYSMIIGLDDWTNLTFPNLTSLVLRNLILGTDNSGVVPFIRRHRSTLQELVLAGCSLSTEEEAAPPFIWSYFWRELERDFKLTKLVAYRPENESDPTDESNESNDLRTYTLVRESGNYDVDPEDTEECEEEDLAALNGLQESIRIRNQQRNNVHLDTGI